jgi:hypothetical protein
MTLDYRMKRRLSLVLLLVGLPVYVVLAVNIYEWLGRPSLIVELMIYAVLGVAWALPFRAVFRGIGQADPAGASGSATDPVVGADSRQPAPARPASEPGESAPKG